MTNSNYAADLSFLRMMGVTAELETAEMAMERFLDDEQERDRDRLISDYEKRISFYLETIGTLQVELRAAKSLDCWLGLCLLVVAGIAGWAVMGRG